MKVGRALCNAQIERGAYSLGLRICWHLRAFMTTCIYNRLPVRRAGAFSSSDSSGTALEALWLLWLSRLRSWTKIQFLMSTAVTLIPKPATEQLRWSPTCIGKWEVYPTVLSFSMLPVSKCLIHYLCGCLWSLLVCTPKPLRSFAFHSAWLIGGVGCLRADNQRYLQSSWQTLFNHHQKPPSHVIGTDNPTSTPLLATKRRSSQGRVKWVLLISWDIP